MDTEHSLFQLEREAFQLRRLEVFNWGPFSGLHTADIDPGGTAIIGMTGSGKTTMIDAFVTLLAEKPKYNLASTGGHESDRSLISYVRGVVGSGNDSGDGAHISRKGKTTTGICATYTDGRVEVRLGAILWLDGTSFSNSDLKRLWIFSRHPEHSFEQWLSTHHDGGVRALKQLLGDVDEAQVFDTNNGGKRAFLARVRAFFEVSENAFALLNRAAGLKQLNSIDEIFRELVLDDRSAFERAAEVANDFNTLADIHNELITAQAQQQSLLPVRRNHEAHERCSEELNLQRKLKDLLPRWIALNGKRLWEARSKDLQEAVDLAAQRRSELEEDQKRLKEREGTLFAAYLKIGGSDIQSLRELIGEKRKEAARREQAASDYRHICRNFALDETIEKAAFASNQRQVEDLVAQAVREKDETEEKAFKHGASLASLKQELEEIKTERDQVAASPGSNLPGNFQLFRAELARHLDLTSEELPFAAELVQVKESESAWRGAIERALGGNRLRVLVPSAHLKAALRWVNNRHNQLHVRLLEANPAEARSAEFFSDGFLRKLEFKAHPLREALKVFLASFDLHCVDSPEALERTIHGLTREGLTSGKRGIFEKKDQRRLDEDWCTGFDNRDRLAELRRRAEEVIAREKEASDAFNAARKQVSVFDEKLQLLKQLRDLEFEQIDTAAIQAELELLDDRLRRLTDPESDAGRALKGYEAAKEALARNADKVTAGIEAHTTIRNKHANAVRRVEEFGSRLGEELSVAERELAPAHLPVPADLPAEQIDSLERALGNDVDRGIASLQEKLTDLHGQLRSAMEKAKQADTGALAEAGTELIDIPAYLNRLRHLTEEDLPAKRTRFLDYLNKSSDQGVTQLLTSIKEEVSKIEERIADLNQSLHGVDFKEGRYLRLDLQPVVHDSLRSLERAQKVLRAAALRTDDQGESHYKALQQVIHLLREAAEKKHTVGARALLDPRFRVEFHGAEIERATERVVDRFKGSQGGSGGEKEIIASYILTASLCYALSSEGGKHPLHSTIVLDEAFSKSSRAVANRIINALREFQLHPIFVTPNKEMRLLRTHTKSVIYVHRLGSRATLASISWEELEARVERSREAPVATSS